MALDSDSYVSDGSVGSNASLDFENDAFGDPEYAGEDTGGQALARQLLATHPDYDANIEKWEKYRDCYEANDIYRFIHKHVRESEDSFAERVKRGYYLNYCGSVIDLITAYIFHAPINRNLGTNAALFEDIYRDCDLAGTTYFSFMEDVETSAQIFGHTAVLVDAPAIDGDQVQTEQDRKSGNLRPYMQIYDPIHIRDWEVDRYGAFLWVKLEVCNESTRSWDAPAGTDTRTFVIWDRTSWKKYIVFDDGKNARQVGFGTHPLGVVPLAIFRNIRFRGHSYFGISTIRDIADINLAMLNWSSFGDEEIANRCLNILTMQMDSSGNSIGVNMSHANVIEYGESAQPPQYLTPGSTPLEMISKWIDRGQDQIYRLAKLGGTAGVKGTREATSGIAYAFEFNETNQSLSKRASSLSQGEMDVHRLISLWMGKVWDGVIEYPKEFGVDDFLTELQILFNARTSLTSDTAIRKVEEKVCDKMFARDPMELREKIKSEIAKEDPKPLGVVEGFGSVPGAMTKPASSSGGSSSSKSAD